MSEQLMKKIKRTREPKFTEKRDPYKKYQKAKWKWIDIFMEIEILKSANKKDYIKTVASNYGIKYKMLKNKYNKYTNDANDNINNENR